MGALSSKKTPGQVLLVGPADSGKTTLLYELILPRKDWKADKTLGFQYEEISGGKEHQQYEVGVWDVGGGSSSQLLLQQIYQLVRFQSIIYVINPDKQVTDSSVNLGNGSGGLDERTQLDYGRVQLNQLSAEIELHQVANVHVVFNVREGTQYYENFADNMEEGDLRKRKRKNLEAAIEMKDLESAYPHLKFHSHTVDVEKEKDWLIKIKNNVIKLLYDSSTTID